MRKITSREWNRIGAEYRSVLDGQKYILVYDRQYGTCLEPVQIDDSDGQEKSLFTFEELFLTYKVNAYTEEEARNIAVSSGHCLALMKNLQRVRSLCDAG